MTKRLLLKVGLFLITLKGMAQSDIDSAGPASKIDTSRQHPLDEIIISASRIPENILNSPISIDQLKAGDAKNMGALSCFDAIENMKGVQFITPGLGFKVINTRGFANTTNVRFAQLVDGIDNQAPHIGAPVANALGANDLDIEKVEIIPGISSVLYGMNAVNGLVNIHTKSPFTHKGLSVQQLSGVNHVGNVDSYGPKAFVQTNLRYASMFNSRFAFKINASCTNGRDWVADNVHDLASDLNTSTGLSGDNNPAYDGVNSYGNESSNRRTLTLNGKNYVVARSGYKETEIDDYHIQNYKGDAGIYYRLKAGHELSLTYKGALINSIYQRSNRFRLQDYTLNQYVLNYQSSIFELRTYLTRENTGKSYNIRSLAENMDKAFKPDNEWFGDYAGAYTAALSEGADVSEAHEVARAVADKGRYEPGTDAYEKKKQELIATNNWDYGAALRVKSYLSHSEGLMNWDQFFPFFFVKRGMQLLSGFDYRTYIIIPDGNYFINPVTANKNLLYGKAGGFIQLNKDICAKKIRLSAILRMDKADYFKPKFNPRVTMMYSPVKNINIRVAYQSGYRFPGIFEGFSNVNSGGVKRVGGLKIMSNGIFENSFTKTSIDIFQARVTSDMNLLGITQAQAIEKNKALLKKNPYTYLQPEYVKSFEAGVRGLALQKRLFLDVDGYYNVYDNFIAQVEVSVPKTSNADSIPTYLNSKMKQDRYRLWTNSKSKIYVYGACLGLKYRYSELFSFTGNINYSRLYKTEDKDGLEDGYNTSNWMMNATISSEKLWKGLGAGITARYQNSFDYVSFLVSGRVPSFWTLDAQVNYSFRKPGITAKIGATNLLNKTYYSILGGPSVGGLYYLSLTWEMKGVSGNGN